MRVLRLGANKSFKIFFAALILAGVFWFSFFRQPPESWQLLAKGKLVKIEAERAIYEKPHSPDYYLRVRITNLSSQGVGFDKYQNMGDLTWPFAEFGAKCFLTGGTSLGSSIGGSSPVYLPQDEKQVNNSAVKKFQLGKLPLIAPGAKQEFFLVMPKAKTQIARSWNGSPVWWKSTMLLPNSYRFSPFLITSIDGQLITPTGKNVEWFRFGKSLLSTPSLKPSLATNSFALKFPFHTKTLP